jgi:hypothetical protein
LEQATDTQPKLLPGKAICFTNFASEARITLRIAAGTVAQPICRDMEGSRKIAMHARNMEPGDHEVANLAAKEQILKDSGYRYSFDRELYVNKSLKKAFSVEFIEDHSEEEIARLARDRSPSPQWEFFFNRKPSTAVERELANMLG